MTTERQSDRILLYRDPSGLEVYADERGLDLVGIRVPYETLTTIARAIAGRSSARLEGDTIYSNCGWCKKDVEHSVYDLLDAVAELEVCDERRCRRAMQSDRSRLRAIFEKHGNRGLSIDEVYDELRKSSGGTVFSKETLTKRLETTFTAVQGSDGLFYSTFQPKEKISEEEGTT